MLGLDLGTKLGVSRVFVDGGLDAQTVRLEATLAARALGVRGLIKRYAGPECVGVCIEEPFSGQFSSVKALLPMLGAAVLACELEGLPWTAAHLAKLKILAIGNSTSAVDYKRKPHLGRRGLQVNG